MTSTHEPQTNYGRDDFIEQHGLWTDVQRAAADEVREQVKEHGIRFVRIVFADVHGIVRGKTITADDFFQTFRNGLNITVALLAMDSANIIMMPVFAEDGGFGIKEMGGAGDLFLVPDPGTFRVLPWAADTAWILGDLYLTTGAPVPHDSRGIYRRALSELRAKGFEYVAGLEVEFYIMRVTDPKLQFADSGQPPTPPEVEALTHGYQYQSETHIDEAAGILDILRDYIIELGLPLRSVEDEWGPGQIEFTFDTATGLAPADMMVLFRSAAKQICRRHGYLASFMCKPGLPNAYSSGWHLHESLRSIETGKNAFPADNDDELVSPTARHFIAGLVEHATPGFVFANPTINGYKRINANALAPQRAVWSHDNKAAFVRVVGGGTQSLTHIENRSGEPAANPYLFMASQIIAGMDGMQRQLDPGEPRTDPYVQMDKPALPGNLMDAVDALEGSSLFRERMGDAFVNYLIGIKRHEIDRFLAYVTDWEHREYFESF